MGKLETALRRRYKYWVIHVTCWGTLYAVGTEAQAEQWRAHKANWEGCVARKREATEQEMRDHEFESLTALGCDAEAVRGTTKERGDTGEGETK